MEHLENPYILSADVNPFASNITSFKQYIDDIFLLFNDNTKAFLEYLSQIHEAIRFVGNLDTSS